MNNYIILNRTRSKPRIGFLDILQVVFIIGKLTDTLSIGDWSWWLVLSPIIVGFSFFDMYFTCKRREKDWL